MHESLEPTRTGEARDESEEAIVALRDALVELDLDDDPYPVADADLQEAQRRANVVFEQAENEIEAMQAVVAEVTIAEAESWLRQAPVDAVRQRGAMSVETVDRTVPALLESGYAAEVEVDAEVDSDAGTAEVFVSLSRIADDAASLMVRLAIGDTVRVGVVNRFGLATVSDVPVDQSLPLRISWIRR